MRPPVFVLFRKKVSLNFEVLENQKICQQEYEQADVIILDNLNRMFPNSLGSDPGSSRVLDAAVIPKLPLKKSEVCQKNLVSRLGFLTTMK